MIGDSGECLQQQWYEGQLSQGVWGGVSLFSSVQTIVVALECVHSHPVL